MLFGVAVAATFAAVVLLMVFRGDDDDSDTSSPARPVAPIATATATESELSPAEKASIMAEAGIPPEPDTATWRRYINALKAINPDIVHGKEEKAVDRGRNQCSSFKKHTDRAKLVDLTNQRFTSPDHPEGFGLSTASLILDVVHEHLCPTY